MGSREVIFLLCCIPVGEISGGSWANLTVCGDSERWFSFLLYLPRDPALTSDISVARLTP